MSDLKIIKRIKTFTAKAQRAITVKMTTEELDIMLLVDAVIGQRDNDRPTIIPVELANVG